MIHYSCDRCHCVIDTEQSIRYSVQIEIHAAVDSVEGENNIDHRDHLIELQNILEQLDDSERAEVSKTAYQRRTYDLCSNCQRQFLKNPLSADVATSLAFSDN